MPSPSPGVDPYLESQHFWEDMEVSDVWIEVRRRTGRIPVTIIELLSPTNKTGDGFVEYRLKRRSLIRQKIHLVELDLLLGGRRLPMSLPLLVWPFGAASFETYAWLFTIVEGCLAVAVAWSLGAISDRPLAARATWLALVIVSGA